LFQLATQYFYARRYRLRIDGVKPHAEKVVRLRIVEKVACAGFNQHARAGRAPGQLLRVDMLRRT